MVGMQRQTKVEALAVGLGGGLAVAQGRADPVRVAAAKALAKIDRLELEKALERALGCNNLGVQVWAKKCLDNLRGTKPSASPKRFAVPAGKFKTPGGAFKQ
jgi:hypothetical protein